jgi:hypothetical protein
MPTYAQVGTWEATPGQFVDIAIDDTQQIMPYTQTAFNITQDAPAGANTPYQGYFFLTAADSTKALAAVTISGQLNAWIATYRAQFPDIGAMYARALNTELHIFMPYGMTGTMSASMLGPDNPGAFNPGVPGVDNPLAYGILGKRRHIFLCVYPFRGDYYDLVIP